MLCFQWLQNCLISGERLPENQFLLNLNETKNDHEGPDNLCMDQLKAGDSTNDDRRNVKRTKTSPKDLKSEIDSDGEVSRDELIAKGRQEDTCSNIEKGPHHHISTPPTSEEAQV